MGGFDEEDEDVASAVEMSMVEASATAAILEK
jgi:hypothetical protein